MGSKKRAAADDNEHRAKRTKSPGVRVVGGRIYDSENGKTCHQCRQKTMDFAASCMNMKEDKLCTIKFCHKCLLNRYGEKAEEAMLMKDWSCPKCRGLCNCSVCMKKKGLKPTGLLVRAAKATGFSSVSEMLLVHGSDCLDQYKNTISKAASPKKQASDDKKQTPNFDRKKLKEMKREELKEICNENKVDAKFSKKSSTTKSSLGEISKEQTEANGRNDSLPSKKKGPRKGTSKDAASDVSTPKDAREKNSSGHENAKASDVAEEEDKRSSKDVPYHLIKAGDEKEEKELHIHKYANTSKDVKNNKTKVHDKPPAKSQENKKCSVNIQNKEFGASVPFSPGLRLTTVADIELTTDDVGHALQFLEFCAAFGKALNIKKGYAESVLKDLMRERIQRRCRVHDSLTVRFHIQLLSLILKDMDEESAIPSPTNDRSSWLLALKKCISASPFKSNDLKPDYFDGGDNCYDDLDFSKKLRLLTYLCDEALNTTKLRSWIEQQNSNFLEEQKEVKEKLAALKDKEKQAKQKLQDELAKALIAKNGVPLSIAENDAIISQIKNDVAEAQAERLAALELASKRRQRSYATRTVPVMLDVNGRVFWKLRGFACEGNILLQDMESWGSDNPSEKWLIYKDEQKQEIEKYISSLTFKRPKLVEKVQTLPGGGSETASAC
ncbi:uncharacterized protein LOC101206502 isoform X2 [Cucumis sativus]|uniref:uncharacterized protein LOC101206502 isoform X2 n=1 Tax=Cucumis sativus TaxID=3659 RepID=UPI0005ECEC83|nr:uncharacterized protein LOC101206502 isoform X2 [Cucumis sativus]KAE8649280.1 hypothetical protein Csa_014460 [Cucumis sativus]